MGRTAGGEAVLEMRKKLLLDFGTSVHEIEPRSVEHALDHFGDLGRKCVPAAQLTHVTASPGLSSSISRPPLAGDTETTHGCDQGFPL